MARDPPSLLASTELRDFNLKPSSVKNAKITIIHPQLRDLVLPVERGRILYPRGNGVEEIKWSEPVDKYSDEEEEDMVLDERMDEDGVHKGHITGSTKPFVKLNFTPNCLTSNHGILAAGGQHGELFLTNLPPSEQNPKSHKARVLRETMKVLRPFNLQITLPTRSINNSIIILPDWPDQWAEAARTKKTGFIGRERTPEREFEDSRFCEDEEEEELDESVIVEEDENMEVEDGVDEGEPPLSPATYPNTVPFFHAPRMSTSPEEPITIPSSSSSSFDILTSRRSASFSHARSIIPPNPSRAARQSFSYSTQNQPGQPPIQVVSSMPTSRSTSSSSAQPSGVGIRRLSQNKGKQKQLSDPRILVSNNDQTVKMFSLRSGPNLPATETSYERTFLDSRLDDNLVSPSRPWTSNMNAVAREVARRRSALQDALVPPPPPQFGGRFGWDSLGLNHGITSNTIEDRVMLWERERAQFENVVGMSVGGGRSNAPLRGTISAGQAGSGVPSGRSASMSESRVRETILKDMEDRKLAKIGGARFKYAINHSSLSPDLKTMVSVGDSTDVYLFEVIDGGREFRKIKSYTAATDSGFSTAWSKDGRRFAVASQDGQVTVWDHRSSVALAKFFTSNSLYSSSSSSTSSSPITPSFASDISASRQPRVRRTSQGSGGWHTWEGVEDSIMLVDPITGDPRSGSSSSGREAARVVKFSPEGSSRDLMVFSEENSNIVIVDAKTFHTQVSLPVPVIDDSPGNTPPSFIQRNGVDGGTWGIAGVAFDPSGDWLYAGTERTVVEWDLRRVGGEEGGTWGML